MFKPFYLNVLVTQFLGLLIIGDSIVVTTYSSNSCVTFDQNFRMKEHIKMSFSYGLYEIGKFANTLRVTQCICETKKRSQFFLVSWFFGFGLFAKPKNMFIASEMYCACYLASASVIWRKISRTLPVDSSPGGMPGGREVS